MSSIRGIVFHPRFQYAQENFDYALRKTIQQALSSKTQYIISEQVFAVNDYDFAMLRELDEVMLVESGIPEAELFKGIGEQFATSILDRYFFNYTSDQQPMRFLSQLQRLYNRLWRFGSLELHTEKTRQAVLCFDYPVVTHSGYHIFKEAFLGYSLAQCGAEKLTLSSQDCESKAEDCRWYTASWDGCLNQHRK